MSARKAFVLGALWAAAVAGVVSLCRAAAADREFDPNWMGGPT